jgi:light-independent protochlorophyllide reductase B subunit
MWSVQGIRDARVIFHAPPGCYMMQHMSALCNEWQPDFYSTLVSYADVMMGTEETLEKVLKKVAAEKPRAIIIVTSPVVEITGDDVEGVVKKIGLKKTVVVRPPLGASLGEGKEAGLLSLIDLMKPAAKPLKNAVNLIGPTFNTFNWRADVFELQRMLACIGIRVNTVLCADCTVADIEKAPRAGLNICMYPYDCGIATAREMEKRFGTPYIAEPVPIGFRGSADWLAEIARRCRVDARDYLAREIESALAFTGSLLVSNTLFESSAAMSTDNCDTYSVGISTFLAREMGMDICMACVGTESAARKVRDVSSCVLVNPTFDEKKSLLLETSPAIILGNYYDLKLSTDLGFKNFLFADIPLIGYIFSENQPFMGFMGAKNLVASIGNEIYTKIFIETKGMIEGVISSGDVPWELDAERTLGRIAEMLPHFVRSIALKKIHQAASETALEQHSSVTMKILQEVTTKYTPTRFKAKYATIFSDTADASTARESLPDEPVMAMEWDETARLLLTLVPGEFMAQAVEGTEHYARRNNHSRITAQVVEAYRKELGF